MFYTVRSHRAPIETDDETVIEIGESETIRTVLRHNDTTVEVLTTEPIADPFEDVDA